MANNNNYYFKLYAVIFVRYDSLRFAILATTILLLLCAEQKTLLVHDNKVRIRFISEFIIDASKMRRLLHRVSSVLRYCNNIYQNVRIYFVSYCIYVSGLGKKVNF